MRKLNLFVVLFLAIGFFSMSAAKVSGICYDGPCHCSSTSSETRCGQAGCDWEGGCIGTADPCPTWDNQPVRCMNCGCTFTSTGPGTGWCSGTPGSCTPHGETRCGICGCNWLGDYSCTGSCTCDDINYEAACTDVDCKWCIHECGPGNPKRCAPIDDCNPGEWEYCRCGDPYDYDPDPCKEWGVGGCSANSKCGGTGDSVPAIPCNCIAAFPRWCTGLGCTALCSGSYSCDTNPCDGCTLRNDGVGCTSDVQCCSGDCDTDDGWCFTCTNHKDNVDNNCEYDDECGASVECDELAPGSCANSNLGICGGTYNCTYQDCGAYICSGGACLSSCTNDNDCDPAYFCDVSDSVCRPKTSCDTPPGGDDTDDEDLCEYSYCSAPSDCDELAVGAGAGHCGSFGTSYYEDLCGSGLSCQYIDDTTCESTFPDCTADPGCDEQNARDWCPTDGTWCNNTCNEVDRDSSQEACEDSGGNCNPYDWDDQTGGDDCDPSQAGNQTVCCCGDDANEYFRTRECQNGTGWEVCETNVNDYACCDQTSDCVWNYNCFSDGSLHPTVNGAVCENGVWKDNTAPTTTINPNGGNFMQTTSVSYTLACSDTGGSGCNNTYYLEIDASASCPAPGGYSSTTANPYFGTINCPYGSICDRRICFYSDDNAGNTESPVNRSEIFHIVTNPCAGKICGEPCIEMDGVCDSDMNCYTGDDRGCLLNCSAPSVGPGGVRIWYNQDCGRSNATKCGDKSICNQSIEDSYCSLGGVSKNITGNWTSYTPPSGYLGLGYTFHILINGIQSFEIGAETLQSNFRILTECLVRKQNNDEIYFDNWGNGNVDFDYTIQASDPEGEWNVTYCDLWSDFSTNGGWQIQGNNTVYTFVVDFSPPDITINDPQDDEIFSSNFLVNATVTDTWSYVDSVFYRWENSTDNGPWEQMSFSGGYYTATFDVSLISDGFYDIRVRANDTVGNEDSETVQNILIDREPPEITILLPDPGWYSSDFEVRAIATDNQVVDSVLYRWENSTDNGTWVFMLLDPFSVNEYYNTFSVYSVASGNYTIRVFANDSMGNEGSETVQNIGIDYTDPWSQMTEPTPPGGGYVMSTTFNISWIGGDAHSGVGCYYVIYEYCDPTGTSCSGELYANFPDGQCTSLTPPYEFDARETGVDDLDGYAFYFKSRARDVAGNLEGDKAWETNTTIYIPKLIEFTVTENETNRMMRNYGGRVATNRTVIISVQALGTVTENLNIRIYYYNHTLGMDPPDPSTWPYEECLNTRECNKSITLIVNEAQDRMEVDYYLYAENASDTSITEYLPPTGYFYYTAYHHPLCNFLVKDIIMTILGTSELISIEVRNIQDRFDNIGLRFSTGFAKFVETGSRYIEVPMNPGEMDKIIYARLIPAADNFLLTIVGNSTNDPSLFDIDEIDVKIGFPADFSGLSDFGVVLLIVLAVLIYLKFVRTEN